MADAVRRAKATWDGDLMSGSGVVSAISSGAFTDMPVTWASRIGGFRRAHQPRGARRVGPRILFLHGALGGPRQGRHAAEEA